MDCRLHFRSNEREKTNEGEPWNVERERRTSIISVDILQNAEVYVKSALLQSNDREQSKRRVLIRRSSTNQ